MFAYYIHSWEAPYVKGPYAVATTQEEARRLQEKMLGRTDCYWLQTTRICLNELSALYTWDLMRLRGQLMYDAVYTWDDENGKQLPLKVDTEIDVEMPEGRAADRERRLYLVVSGSRYESGVVAIMSEAEFAGELVFALRNFKGKDKEAWYAVLSCRVGVIYDDYNGPRQVFRKDRLDV